MGEQQSNILILDERTLRAHERREESDFVLDFIDKSSRYREQFVNIWSEVLDNYLVSGGSQRTLFPVTTSVSHFGRGPNVGRFTRSRLKDPETHQIIETLSAQAIGLLLGSREYLAATPIGSDDPEKARFLSRILMGVLEQPGIYRTIFQLIKNSYIFGTSIVEVGWQNLQRMQMTPVEQFDELGMLIGETIEPRLVNYRNGPTIREVDIYDFYPDPSGTRIQEDMYGCAKRFRIGKFNAKDLANQNVYDREAVKRAVDDPDLPSPDTTPHKKFANLPDDTAQKYGQMTGFEFWGEVPWRPMDGARNRVITLLNGENVRSHINPFINGEKPFKEIVSSPLGGRFYGLGKAEVVRFMQDSTDALLMVMTDVANAAVNAPTLVGTSFRGDINQIKNRKPNDVILAGDVTQVIPFPVDFTVIQMANIEIARRKQGMREGTGATGVLQAIPTTKRQTATETVENTRLATQRVEVDVQVMERNDFPWLGRTIHSRLRQFLSDEGAVATLAGEQFAFGLKDIDMEADVRFMGSRFVISRQQKASGIGQILSILGTNPMVAELFPDLLVRLFRDGFDIDDAQEIVDKFVQKISKTRQQNPELVGGAPNPTNVDTPVSPAAAAQEGGQAL